ncbi:MAG TPA: hypothetical protein VIX73_24655 [Kofleriaceae bacterium]|jgi:hypothetical protein
MKPVLLLAFLALGPALADLIPVTRPVAAPEAAAAMTETQHPAAASPIAPLEGERAWLCGR